MRAEYCFSQLLKGESLLLCTILVNSLEKAWQAGWAEGCKKAPQMGQRNLSYRKYLLYSYSDCVVTGLLPNTSHGVTKPTALLDAGLLEHISCLDCQDNVEALRGHATGAQLLASMHAKAMMVPRSTLSKTALLQCCPSH